MDPPPPFVVPLPDHDELALGLATLHRVGRPEGVHADVVGQVAGDVPVHDVEADRGARAAGAVVPLDTRTLYLKHLQLHGSSQGRRQDFRRVVRYIEEGKINSILHKTWKLSELHKAQADFVSKNYVGKMAVVPDSKWEQVGAKHAR